MEAEAGGLTHRLRHSVNVDGIPHQYSVNELCVNERVLLRGWTADFSPAGVDRRDSDGGGARGTLLKLWDAHLEGEQRLL